MEVLMHFIRGIMYYVSNSLNGMRQSVSMQCNSTNLGHAEVGCAMEDDAAVVTEITCSRQNSKPRDGLPKLLQLVTPEYGDIDVDQVKQHVNLYPDSIFTDVDSRGRDTVLHRFIEVLEEDSINNAEAHRDLLEFLVNKCANVNSKNISLETPLHIAARHNKYKTIRMLIDKDPCIINEKNADNNTCLHIAVKYASIEAVAVLHCYADRLNEGIENKQGFTALQLAEQVEFNDNKTAMEKICQILHRPVEEYNKNKEHTSYLEKESCQELWSLRPVTNIYNKVEAGAVAVIGGDIKLSVPDEKVAKSIQIINPGSRPAILPPTKTSREGNFREENKEEGESG